MKQLSNFDPEFTILMPCLNERRTLPLCIREIQKFLSDADVSTEILVADNGSTDGSPAIARKMGARVISVARQGYGNALTGGINAARGRYIIMGDCDYSYDFSGLFCIDIWGFLCSLIWAGNDFIHLFTIFIVAYAVFPQMLFVVCICSVPEWNLQQK